MTEERLQAYENLIQALLTCPEGEEWDLLQANQELVDPEFIQVIERVAGEKEKAGEEDAATFLRDVLAELGHFQAYMDLIEMLLNCENEADVESLLNANQNLLDAGLVQSMLAVANDLLVQGDGDNANFLMNLAGELMGIYENYQS
ncbi:MAG: hypothetical protein QNJ63_10475 [Calothrix sp. MO_192.B10]|nr:hypothetical protein [Calothrix sp. MO_192.B10]